MDQQRPLLYLTLIFLGFMIWTAWQQDHAPKPAPSVTSTAQAPGIPANPSSAATASDIPQQPSGAQPVSPIVNGQAGTQGTIVHVKTDTLDIQINTHGGEIVQAALPTYPISIDQPDIATIILDRKKQYSAQSGLLHRTVAGQDTKDLAPNHHAIYNTAKTEYIMPEGSDTLVVPLSWDNGKGIAVSKRFTFKRGDFLINVEHEVTNNSGQAWSGSEYRQLRHGPVQKTGSFLSGAQAYTGSAYYNLKEGKYNYEKLKFSDFSDDDEKVYKEIKGGWAAMLEHYFVSSWVPAQDQTHVFYSNYVAGNTPSYIFGIKTPDANVVNVANGSSHTFSNGFYVGPKSQDKLAAIANGLDMTVDYGIFSIFSKPIFWLLNQLHSVFNNWGWAIIFVTLIIKLIFFWPSAISYKSMAKMKKLSPKMKELSERYKNDPQAKQKAMMNFYRKEKINPLGGCLPMLIQIPIFMGLYWVLQESVELRQAPWILWYKDLSIMDPWLILPLIMGASMWLQQKLNPPQMDPMQQKIFQWLPVVFTVMFLFFPAGLVLYWVVNNILSMAQQWYINKKIIGD